MPYCQSSGRTLVIIAFAHLGNGHTSHAWFLITMPMTEGDTSRNSHPLHTCHFWMKLAVTRSKWQAWICIQNRTCRRYLQITSGASLNDLENSTSAQRAMRYMQVNCPRIYYKLINYWNFRRASNCGTWFILERVPPRRYNGACMRFFPAPGRWSINAVFKHHSSCWL